jgi:hypothetical protein
VSGVGCQVSALLLITEACSLIEKETDERRTSNIERPTSNNEFFLFKKGLSNTRRTSACASGLEAYGIEDYGLEALHERICPSKFDTAELVAGCGSLVLKSTKRSVINIGRSMFDVQSIHCSDQTEFHSSAAAGQKNGQSDQKRNFWDSVWKSAVVGFRISL